MTWLLKTDVAQAMERALRLGVRPTTQQLEKFAARIEARLDAEASSSSMPPNMTVAGDVAEIRVEGVLTEKPDFWAWLLFGSNTSYEDIRASLALAAADPAIKRVELAVASPGGSVTGLFDTLAAIEAFQKPMSVKASLAASAAYAIAAVAGPITATSVAAEFGSIGVAAKFVIDENVVDITSTEAPNKRPNPATEEGQAVIRAELDALHDLFVESIARGRGTKPAIVNADFGRGGTFLAAESKKRGMVDKIAKAQPRAMRSAEASPEEPETAPPIKVATATEGGEQQKETPVMDLKTLQASHPALYAEVVGIGEKSGAAKERDRVNAHLIRGAASGDMKTALAAVESGAEMTETFKAKYDAAAMNRNSEAARQAETDSASAAVDGAKPVAPSGAKDVGDEVVAILKGGKQVA
jgi:ClpP class serine protease